VHKLFLALRYLRKKRIVFFGIAAVTLCVALLIVITSIFNGFVRSLHDYWRQSQGQIQLSPRIAMHPYEALVEQIENIDGIAAARATTGTGGLLYLGPGDVRAVGIVGLDLNRNARDEIFHKGLLLQSAPTFQKPVADFSLSPEIQEKFTAWYEKKFRRPPTAADMPVGIIVGIGVLAQPDKLTDKYDRHAIIEQLRQRKEPMYIISGKQGEMTAQKIRRLCWPVDVLETGTLHADTNLIYLPFDYTRDLVGNVGPTGEKECLGQIGIYLEPNIKNPIEIARITQQVQQTWMRFATTRMNWSEPKAANVNISDPMQTPNALLITQEIRKQLAIMQILVGLVCVVAALLIFVTLKMIVMQRTKDIGIIRALGSTRVGIAAIFLAYGAAVGLTGSILGLALGAWSTRNINLIESVITKLLGFKIWKSGVYFFRDIPNEVDWSSTWWILITGLITATLGALLPAIRAARLQPVDSLRYE